MEKTLIVVEDSKGIILTRVWMADNSTIGDLRKELGNTADYVVPDFDTEEEQNNFSEDMLLSKCKIRQINIVLI